VRIDNILIQPIDASDGQEFVIMDESSGAEIVFSRAKLIQAYNAIGVLLYQDNLPPFRINYPPK
jgi:hypothetical protein